MANEQLIITGIEYKVKKLIELNASIVKENLTLKRLLSEREDQVTGLTKELGESRNELVKITLAKMLEKEFGVEESRLKLEDLIAEIDRCIEVLSE
ncbi:MAG: hypothetical protein Q8O72_11110 [Bacteroidales bacterium]|nr:hypothetical protein [Bacteroidales bacterium]